MCTTVGCAQMTVSHLNYLTHIQYIDNATGADASPPATPVDSATHLTGAPARQRRPDPVVLHGERPAVQTLRAPQTEILRIEGFEGNTFEPPWAPPDIVALVTETDEPIPRPPGRGRLKTLTALVVRQVMQLKGHEWRHARQVARQILINRHILQDNHITYSTVDPDARRLCVREFEAAFPRLARGAGHWATDFVFTTVLNNRNSHAAAAARPGSGASTSTPAAPQNHVRQTSTSGGQADAAPSDIALADTLDESQLMRDPEYLQALANQAAERQRTSTVRLPPNNGSTASDDNDDTDSNDDDGFIPSAAQSRSPGLARQIVQSTASRERRFTSGAQVCIGHPCDGHLTD